MSDGLNDQIDAETSPCRLLLDQTIICTTGELPKSYREMSDMLWNAFHRGQRYEQLGGDAACQAEYVKQQKAREEQTDAPHGCVAGSDTR